jgi:hypothetical protein
VVAITLSMYCAVVRELCVGEINTYGWCMRVYCQAHILSILSRRMRMNGKSANASTMRIRPNLKCGSRSKIVRWESAAAMPWRGKSCRPRCRVYGVEMNKLEVGASLHGEC